MNLNPFTALSKNNFMVGMLKNILPILKSMGFEQTAKEKLSEFINEGKQAILISYNNEFQDVSITLITKEGETITRQSVLLKDLSLAGFEESINNAETSEETLELTPQLAEPQ